jgi:hypothetical protein
MLVNIESAPFNSGKLRHSTSNQLFIIERKTFSSKSPMEGADDKEHIAAKGPGVNVANK